MNYTSEERPVIQVNTLGGFSLTLGEKNMGDNDNRSRKAWSLLCFLIMNRKKELGIGDLFAAIWPDESQDNPYGALKTLVFRVRKMLEAAGFPAQELLVNRHGTYAWSSESLGCRVDAERFEELCHLVLDPGRPMAGVYAEAMEAVALYRGYFLPKSGDESWVIPISAYYHSLYQKVVCRTATYLTGEKRYEETVDLCRRAVAIDPYDEHFYYHLIYASFLEGRQEEALKLYNETTEMFYRDKLITPSESFKELYRVISSRERPALAQLDQIQRELGEAISGQDGAYLCEYAVFKRLFQIEQRGVERSGDSIYLCLLTVSDRQGRMLRPEIQSRAMERLKQSVKCSLRSSDAFSRYSVSQYIILLPTTTYENGERVVRRILGNFNRNYVRKDVAINYSLSPILPG